MSEYAQVLDRLDEVLRRLDALTAPQEPALTVTAFAKRIGKHPNTVFRWIEEGRVQKRKGLVPHSELRKFLS